MKCLDEEVDSQEVVITRNTFNKKIIDLVSFSLISFRKFGPSTPVEISTSNFYLVYI